MTEGEIRAAHKELVAALATQERAERALAEAKHELARGITDLWPSGAPGSNEARREASIAQHFPVEMRKIAELEVALIAARYATERAKIGWTLMDKLMRLYETGRVSGVGENEWVG